MTIRCVVAGMGDHFAENIIPAILQNRSISVVYALTRNEEKALRIQSIFPKCERLIQIEDLQTFHDKFDCVVCCGPPAFNNAIASISSKMSKYVLCEKPMHWSVEKYKSCDKFLQFGYNLTYSRAVQELVEISRNNGGIKHVNINYRTNKPIKPIWGLPTTEASLLYAVACHPIHLAAIILKMPILRSSSVLKCGGGAVVTIRLQSQSGTVCDLLVDNLTAYMTFSVTVWCCNGQIVTLQDMRDLLWEGRTIRDEGDKTVLRRRRASIFSSNVNDAGFILQLAAFCATVEARRSVDQEVGWNAAKLVNEIIRSICPIKDPGCGWSAEEVV